MATLESFGSKPVARKIALARAAKAKPLRLAALEPQPAPASTPKDYKRVDEAGKERRRHCHY